MDTLLQRPIEIELPPTPQPQDSENLFGSSQGLPKEAISGNNPVMGLFSSSKAISPQFELPSVRLSQCQPITFPNMSSMYFPDLTWVQWQMRKKQPQHYWIEKISNSEDFWMSSDINVPLQAQAIAARACEMEGFTGPVVEHIYPMARFGVLAGMFERASHAVSIDYFHPLIWNSIIAFNMSLGEHSKKLELPRDSMLLREATTLAGYVYGKRTGMSLDYVFSAWRQK